MDNAAVTTKQKHPSGLYMLFMVEMWERFNYYGMRALLSLFMISSVIQYTRAQSSKIYGMFTALVYLTPVFGGYLADRFIGKRHSITIGAILMAIGQFTLASYDIINPKVALFTGLTLIILGNGFFKPNISTIVGELYPPKDARRDSGFTIFYMGINVGAFIAPFVCGFLGEPSPETTHSFFGLFQFHYVAQWKYGFMAAGIGMCIGLIWYWVSQKKYLGEIGLYPVTSKMAVDHVDNKPLTSEEIDKIKAIFTFVFFAIFFFAFFEQAGTSLNFFAEQATKLAIGPIKLKASYFQAVNPICVVIFAPIFAKMWIKMGTKNPSIPVKFGWGLFLQGIAFMIIAIGASIYAAKGPVSALWLIFCYFFCTMGELCLSPVGLSMVTKLAPAKFMSLFMGVWLAASFIGNLLAGKLASYYDEWSLTTLFSIPAICSIVFGIIMWIMAGKVRKWMHGVN